jgi:probable rRNA maturation factor
MVEKKAIYFFNEGVSYVLCNKKNIRKWIISALALEKYVPTNINYIFCSDQYLNTTNVTYLKHDTYTDIITFDTSDNEDEISGDIFISIDRVKDNARIFNVPFESELKRVMIHGILHLIGYKDKSKKEKELMRAKEDYYLSLLPEFIQ